MVAVARFFQIAVIAMAASFLGGFVAVPLVVLAEEGPAVLIEEPFAIFGWLFLGAFGAFYAVIIATVPAMLLGGLLQSLRIGHRGVWAGIGALAGCGCYFAAGFVPGSVGELVRNLSGPEPLRLVPAFAVAGALAALFFRMLAALFAGFDDDEAEQIGAPRSA